MNVQQAKQRIADGALEAYGHLYADPAAQRDRYLLMLDRFAQRFGEDREVWLFSVPGRSELSGNHTDHNRGCVLAGAIDRDIVAVVSPREDGEICLWSCGFPEDRVCLSDVTDPARFARHSSASLIAGVADGFAKRGYTVGGFDAYTETEVLKGSGLSSSAAFEVMVGNILSHLYNGGAVPAPALAEIAQYAENVYFGKPCGLMDQMACAVGGFVYIDFADPAAALVERIPFSLTDAGYALCIVNTGGNHADLNEDYASVPSEMKAVARALGVSVLRETEEPALLARLPQLRETLGDRALLRALHFFGENRRVLRQKQSLAEGRLEDFLADVLASGRSSFCYLQNVYTNKAVEEQGLSLALCLAEGFLADRGGAWRVHGGGFAGTVQAFVPVSSAEEFASYMDGFFGQGATMTLHIRGEGAVAIRI